MGEVTIKSARDGLRLSLGAPVGKGGDGAFLARLDGGPAGPTAEVNVYDFHYDTLPRFFDELAAGWQGWEGTKSWSSLEGHLRLDASADRLGHIFLRVRLRSIDFAADWQVHVTLLLEAGQLESLAAEARRVFADTDVA